MKRHLAAALAALVAATGLAATAPYASAATTMPAAMPAFYTPPATLPSGNGTLIRSERVNSLLNVWGNTTRIMYTSTDTNSQRVAVTGTYIEPWGAWTGTGPRPVVAYASGTIGQGDQCAPSMNMTSIINVSGNSFTINYETSSINNLLAKGIAVVLTDYVGLGTTDRVHTYMNREDQAHAVLDAARAAAHVPGASVTPASKVATYGYSQGGGAAAAAAELQPSYAPDLNLAGAYAGAPPADLVKVLDGIDGSAIMGVAGYFTNGMLSENPSLKPYLDANTNAAGKAALANLANQCIGDTITSYGFQPSSKWTADGQPLRAVLERNPDIMAVADRQRIGRLKPTAPVRVATGVHDDIVPHAQARQLAVDWCGLGANVTYAPIAGVNMGDKTGANHVLPMPADALPAANWIADRLNGKSVTSNCSAIASMK